MDLRKSRKETKRLQYFRNLIILLKARNTADFFF